MASLCGKLVRLIPVNIQYIVFYVNILPIDSRALASSRFISVAYLLRIKPPFIHQLPAPRGKYSRFARAASFGRFALSANLAFGQRIVLNCP